MSFTTLLLMTKPSNGATGWDVAINADLDQIDAGLASIIMENGFRVTTVTATPVPTSDQVAAATVYVTPMRGTNAPIWVWSGSAWEALRSGELSLSLTGLLVSGKNYDVYVTDNGSGVLAMGIGGAWTTDIARSDALVNKNGVWVLTSDNKKRVVGTIRATGTGTIEDSLAKRFVWNMDNRVRRAMKVVEATANWNPNTNNGTFTQARNTATNQLDYLVGLAEDEIEAWVNVQYASTVNGTTAVAGIGLDVVNANSAHVYGQGGGTPVINQKFPLTACYRGIPGLGRHFITWIEANSAITTTFYGATATYLQSGIHGFMMG